VQAPACTEEGNEAVATDTRLRQAQPPAYRRWLTQLEAAAYLGVTDRTIRNLISRGALEGRRIQGSRMVKVDREKLDAILRPIPTVGPAA
jgi:excisionase family DNA binding protein